MSICPSELLCLMFAILLRMRRSNGQNVPTERMGMGMGWDISCYFEH